MTKEEAATVMLAFNSQPRLTAVQRNALDLARYVVRAEADRIAMTVMGLQMQGEAGLLMRSRSSDR